MKPLKRLLEKPRLIWFLIAVAYVTMQWVMIFPNPTNMTSETRTLEALQAFSDGEFPPVIGNIRELKDWGHPAYYALAGRLNYTLKWDINKLRFAHLVLMLLTFLVFVRLGNHFTYRNRLNPAWVSGALLILAANPYIWRSAMTVNPYVYLLLCTLVSLWAFESDRVGWASVFASLAVMGDWVGVLLPVAFIATRMTEERGRVVNPMRIAGFLLPFVFAALLYFAWGGFIPQADATGWASAYLSEHSVFQLFRFNYAVVLFPLYTLWFTWTWGFRARTRATAIGAIVTVLSIPLFFMAPIQADIWEKARSGLELPQGYVDLFATMVAGEYKNLLLFIPFLVGVFLIAQLALMDVLDRSRCLRFFIFLFFAAQPFLIGSGDVYFVYVIPFILLFSLSEALVGEEGNLMR